MAVSDGGASGEPAGPGHGASGEEAARLICLRLLAAGPRTRAQLAGSLRRRRVPDAVVNAVLDRFAEVGLIDDAAFAQAWVETRHRGRGLAGRMLAAELRQRGIAAEQVRAAVGALGTADELATARRLVAQRVAATRGRSLPARTRRLVGLLARRGYPAGLAYQVVREALEQDSRSQEGRGVAAGDPGEDVTGEDWPGDEDWSGDEDWPLPP